MASLGINDAVIQGSSSLNYVINDLFGTLKGWKKKVYFKKTNIPNKKDVNYISPNGEEIKSSKQLVKYLKVHPGSLKVGDFCWTSAETPRRSIRLNQKLGRRICFEELELLPTKHKKKKVDCNVRNDTLNSSKRPKHIVLKEEPVDELKMLKTLEEPLCKSQEETKLTNEINKLYKSNNDSQLYDKKLVEDKIILQQMPLDVQNVEDFDAKEAIVLPKHITLSTIHVLKNTHETPKQQIETSNTLIEEVELNDKLTAAYEETQIQGGHTKDETIIVENQSHFDTNIVANKMDVEKNLNLKEGKTDKIEDADIALVKATTTSIMPPPVEKPKVDIEIEVVEVDNKSSIHKNVNGLIEEIEKEDVDFTFEKPLEGEIVEEQRMDVDMLNVDHITIVQRMNKDFNDTKVTELPKIQGIHALVDNTTMFESKEKS